MLEFSILGSVQVRHEGRLVAVAGGRQRALLALLLVHHDKLVSTDRAIDHLWPDAGLPQNPRNALQQCIAKLRRALAPIANRDAGPLIATGDAGYILHLESHRLDAEVFEQLLAEARRAGVSGDPARVVELLRQASELWRGVPFGDHGSMPLLRGEARRLGELRLVAIEERIEAELALGRSVPIAAELSALIERHPYRERLHAQLMLALYRAGRQRDALAAYRRAYRMLESQLGVAPGQELRRLEQRILKQDPELDRAPPLGDRPPRSWTIYPLLESIRRFVDAADAPGHQHASLLLAVTEAANSSPAMADVRQWTTALASIETQIDDAILWSLDHAPDTGLRLAVEACLWWDWRAHRSAAADTLRRLLDTGAGAPGTRARALTWLAFFDHQLGRPGALGTIREAIDLGARVDDPVAEGGALAVHSILLRRDDSQRAIAAAERSVGLLGMHGTARERAYAHVCHALALTAAGHSTLAEAPAEEAATIYAELGDLRGEAWTAGVRAELARVTGNHLIEQRLRSEALAFAASAEDEATRRWIDRSPSRSTAE